MPGLLFFLVTVLILIATLYPSNKSFSFDIWDYDKVGHFIMFGGWTFLYGIYRAFKKARKPNLWIVFFLGSFYGLIIEVLQYIVPTNRSPELMDLVADIFGALAAILVLHLLFKKLFSSEEDPTT